MISPLLKKPNLDVNNLKNYRPVSNLPFLSKVIEKAVTSQLNLHLSKNNQESRKENQKRKIFLSYLVSVGDIGSGVMKLILLRKGYSDKHNNV